MTKGVAALYRHHGWVFSAGPNFWMKRLLRLRIEFSESLIV